MTLTVENPKSTSLLSYFEEYQAKYPSLELAHQLSRLQEAEEHNWTNPLNKAQALAKIVTAIGETLPAGVRNSRDFQQLQSNIVENLRTSLNTVAERTAARTIKRS